MACSILPSEGASSAADGDRPCCQPCWGCLVLLVVRMMLCLGFFGNVGIMLVHCTTRMPCCGHIAPSLLHRVHKSAVAGIWTTLSGGAYGHGAKTLSLQVHSHYVSIIIRCRCVCYVVNCPSDAGADAFDNGRECSLHCELTADVELFGSLK